MKKTLMAGVALAALSLYAAPASAELMFAPGEDDRFTWENYEELQKTDLSGQTLTVFGPWRGADEELHTALLSSGLPFRPGFSSAPNRSWREPSWVVMDMDEDEFDRLAQRFGQLGALRWQRGEPVRLRMYAQRPVLARVRDCLDWVEPESSTASGPRPHATR